MKTLLDSVHSKGATLNEELGVSIVWAVQVGADGALLFCHDMGCT